MPSAQSAVFQHDQPQIANDLYSRKPFAEQLARLLVLPPKSPGVVIGIEGAWGSGKTTVVRYIVESLKSSTDEVPIVVEFNPWMLAGADALVEALLTELASGIGMDAGKKRAKKSLEAAGKILGYAGLLRHLKYLKYVPGVSLVGVAADTVGNALHDASKLATKAGEAVDNAKKVVEEAEKLVSIKAGLSERKKEVIKALAELDCSIVVIVDDLDRLTPDEIKAVFRTIKAVADFPRVSYLLAYDRNVVSESLGGGPAAGGNAYIEKIVQVAYPISPAFPWQLQSHISGEISNLLESIHRKLEPFESEILGKATTLTCTLCRYPRDIVRLMNRLMLSLASTTHEVNASDVIVAEALFQRFPKIRDAVVQNPEQFTGFFWSVAEEASSADWSMYFSGTKEERRTAWQAHLPENQPDKAAASAALKFLFPITNGSGSNSPPRSHLRLSELSRLIRFFTLTSVTGVQEVADVHKMLAEPSQLGNMLNDLDYAGATEMVNHMTAYIDTAKSIDCTGVVRELIRSCTKEEFHASSPREYSRSVAVLAANCIQRTGAQTSSITLEFLDGIPLTYGLDFLVTVGTCHGEIRLLDQYKIANASIYIDNAQIVSTCIDSWRKRAETAVMSGSVIGRDDLFAILYGLSHIGRNARNIDAINAFQAFCLQVESGLKHFLDRARPLKELQPQAFFLYVWDANAMATLVEQSPFADEFAWYTERLRTDPEVHKFIQDRCNT
ncbi:KAP family P-loop NTPase fold protein [Paraburkholderia phenazinium]|uniref:KAP family P-loop domain-containing protein n=1 Tax=Paraburkholderia phenazinium TaxID=60549 RepID=A0A1N6FI34_9BURK|nr:P-loop NTPase fold protein [Paraburkholderia phenazinium]SIN94890.1 KAP family P-loop domain-containing protein [Paraburkholderia phenazinium]